ncbi:hypothetical protein QQX10_00505 [Demequina sp. SYSU T00039]|uniref:Uncharacterized protein n=1 Tax=Demequina lignilytica TaxID=3051663 RepID=A0AAW7M168_9MICO|nr:hypothetical protein [Demequina sp. SYSU T00039]MDN4486642.1 hypothetical protein [Demequina sp. SYSU T00039]
MTDTDAHAAGQRAERDRIVAYLAFHEASARAKADQAESDDSRVYQSTIANAMKAMGEAIAGDFHWKAPL